MLRQVFRKGDRVIFEGREHVVDRVENGSQLVSFVVQGDPPHPPGSHRTAHLHRVGQTENGIAPIEQLKHSCAGDEIRVVIAPGFRGVPANWCYWELEYPEDGALGPFNSRADTLAIIAESERVNRCHYHVSEAPVLESDAHEQHFNRDAGNAIGSRASSGNRRLEAVLRLCELAARGGAIASIRSNVNCWAISLDHDKGKIEVQGKDLFVVIDRALKALAICTEKR